MERGWFVVKVCVVGLVLPLTASVAQTNGVEDLPYEKEQITKGEWLKLKADKKKSEQEDEKKLEDKFPVKASYGKNGFLLESRNAKFSMELGGRL